MPASHIPIQRSLLRRYLMAAYTLFIVYASLMPFTGWQEQGLYFADVLRAPFRHTYTAFDALTNLLAYLPFGLLLALTLHAKLDARRSVLWATLAGLLFSATMEYLQLYLPRRASSNLDILANAGGALLGALLAMAMARRAWFARLTAWRAGLFSPGAASDFGLALLALWLFSQINPALPLFGSVFITEPAARMYMPAPEAPFNHWVGAAVALNLLLGGLLLALLLRQRRHLMHGMLLLLGIVALAKFLAAAALLKSWALLLWLNGEAMLGISAGLLLLALAARLGRPRLLLAAGLAALCYLVLAQWFIDSGTPSAAMRLYHWRYGHLRNFNGLSQAVSSLFPLLLCGYLWWARGPKNHFEGEA